MRATSITILVLALLAPAPASAIYQCGPLTDDCQCGMSNPYPCCANGGNCTWFAWDSACCNWGIGLPGWGHAKSWAGAALSHPSVEVFNAPSPGCIACRIAPQFNGDEWGHVAWVTAVNGSQITVDEMACDSYYGWMSKGYSASYFEKYICLSGSVTVECGDGACTGNEDCSSCPEDCACADFCDGKMNGLWCDGDNLVNCQNGQVTTSETCPCGCKSNELGVADECESCGGGFCDGKMNGLWCDGDDLVNCQNGQVTTSESCPCGCKSNELGVADECEPCGGGFCDDKDNGLWCDGDMLVFCQGGVIGSTTSCPCGCKSNGADVNDECEPCGGGFCDGLADGFWCDDTALTYCVEGQTVEVENCPRGCQPPPDQGEGHCIAPTIDTSTEDISTPGEDTQDPGEDTVSAGDLVAPTDTLPGTGSDGPSTIVLEEEDEWDPGPPSSGCAAGADGSSFLPWSILLLLGLAASSRFSNTPTRTAPGSSMSAHRNHS